MYLCNTTLFDGRDMYGICYIKNNYMFRHFTLVIFRLRNEKNLVSSYTRLMWVVYSGEVRGEVGTRSGMCYVGWAVWVCGGSAVICCLPCFFISQPEDGHCQVPKHVGFFFFSPRWPHMSSWTSWSSLLAMAEV